MPGTATGDDYDAFEAVSAEFRQNVCELLECDTTPDSASRAQLESVLLGAMDLNLPTVAELQDVRRANSAAG